MRRPRAAWMLAVLAVVCIAGFAVEAAQQYTFSTAGNVPLAFSTTFPLAISLEYIVGFYTGPNMDGGYIQKGSKFITPVPQKGSSSYLSAMNRHGIAVGGFCTDGCSYPASEHGYTYDLATRAVAIFDFPGTSLSTDAYGINDFGEIVGGYCPGTTGCPQSLGNAPTHGFLLSNQTYTTLDYPDALVTGTACNAINDAGTIVGFYNTDSTEHGFMYQNGTYSLVDFPGGLSTFPMSINNSGVIAGYFADSSGVIHVFTDSNGTFNQVDVPPQHAQVTTGGAINDAGVLVGIYLDLHGSFRNFKAVPKHSAP